MITFSGAPPLDPLFFIFYNYNMHLRQGCKNLGRQVTQATKFCTVVLNICGSSVRNLIHIALLMPIILRFFKDFC
jgi:hypothetical protein